MDSGTEAEPPTSLYNSENPSKEKENKKAPGGMKKLIQGSKAVVKHLCSFVGVFILLTLYIVGGDIHTYMHIYIYINVFGLRNITYIIVS